MTQWKVVQLFCMDKINAHVKREQERGWEREREKPCKTKSQRKCTVATNVADEHSSAEQRHK